MFLRKSFDKKTGIYRSSDSIENFKFRVTLKKLNCLIRVPKLYTTMAISGHPAVETKTSQPPAALHDVDEADELETHNIRWNEKRLSQKEINFYSDQENCETDMHKEYHRLIKINRLDDEHRMCDKIFTYVPDDCYAPPCDDDGGGKYVGNGAAEPSTEAEANKESNLNAVKNQRRTKRCQQRRRRMWENSCGGNDESVNIRGVYETMYVMADLVASSVETVLFIIRWNAGEGLLLVYPDFNVIHSDPYLKEINADSRHMYQYALENLSTKLEATNDGQEIGNGMNDVGADAMQLNSELQVISKKLSGLSVNAALSTLFTTPPRRCTYVYLFGTILSAECFEYDNIHIRYRVTLPDRCVVFDDFAGSGDDEISGLDSLLIGSTHSSYKSHVDGTWRFGYCFELAIRCMEDYRFNDFLKISYEAISIDGWQRERTEGYAVQTIPFEAVHTNSRLRCFRETSNTIVERLERYFIGGRRKFDADAFHGINVCTKLNRYGNHTKSTGTLTVANQIVLQRDVHFLATNTNNEKTASLGFSVSATTKSVPNQITVDDVVLAYQTAKRRLEATTSR